MKLHQYRGCWPLVSSEHSVRKEELTHFHVPGENKMTAILLRIGTQAPLVVLELAL